MQGKLCCKTRPQYDKLLSLAEMKVMQFMKRIHEVQTTNIEIELTDPSKNKKIKTFIHTHLLEKQNKPVSVFLHGFGASVATLSEFFEELAEEFTVYGIDLLGQGCSGKPDIDYINLSGKQCVDLFVESLEAWREKMGLTKFHIHAHSMGAYFASFYCHKYPEHVESFSLISCAGMTTMSESFRESHKAGLKGYEIKRKLMYKFWHFMNKGYLRGWSAFSFMPLKFLLSHWMQGRQNYTEEQKEAVVEYLSLLFWDKNYSCDIIIKIYDLRAYSNYPVVKVLPELSKKVPIRLYYGETDWLDRDEARKQLAEKGGEFEIFIVEDCGHQIPVLKPKLMVKLLMQFYRDTKKEEEIKEN